MQTNQAYKKHVNGKARKSWQEAMKPYNKANKPARGKERML